MDWSALGIEPTADKKAITKAYRGKLIDCNPEDKPEEFKALREAYEQALSYATDQAKAEEEAGSAPAVSLTPVDQWAADVAALYADFPRRISVDAWRELLDQDICFALDTHGQVEDKLLQFLSQQYFLPQDVWALLDERFHWIERQDELCERMPREFVEYVLVDGVLYDATLRYDLYEPGENGEVCDEYLRTFLAATRTPFEEVDPLIQALKEMPESHPYGRALELRVRLDRGDESALELMEQLVAQYAEDTSLSISLIDAYLDLEQFEKAEALASVLHKALKSHSRITTQLAFAMAGQKKYADAVELINELMRSAGGDQKKLYDLGNIRSEWNISLIEQYEDQLAKDPANNKARQELSWCYLQNERDKEAYEVAKLLDPEQMQPFEWHNLMSQLYMTNDEMEKAYEHSVELAQVLREMQPDGTEKTDTRIKRLPEVVARAGYCLYMMDRYEEAIAKYEEALALRPDDAETLTYFSQVLASMEQYERAIEVAERLTKVMPSSYHGYYLLAQLFYEINNDRDAFENVKHALQLEQGDLGAYVLQARILIRNGAAQEAYALINFLHEQGVEDDSAVLWCEGLLAEMEEEDRDKARGIYQTIADRFEDKDTLGWAGKIFFRLALLTAKEEGEEDEHFWNRQLAFVERGLELDKKDKDCLDFRGWLLTRLDRVDDAIEAYEKLRKIRHDGLNPERALADLYRKNLEENAAKALEMYQFMLEEDPEDVVSLYYAGLCCYRMGRYEEAIGYLEREKVLEPDCIDSYRMLSFVHQAMGAYREALDNAQAVIRLAHKNDEAKLSQYYRLVVLHRRLREPEEAVKTVRRAMELFNYDEGFKDIFEIYSQFGMFDKAERAIEEWTKHNNKLARTSGHPDFSSAARAKIFLGFYEGNYSRVKLNLMRARMVLRKEDLADVEREIWRYDGAFNQLISSAHSNLDDKLAKGSTPADCVTEYERLAFALWQAGDKESAEKYARTALKHLDEKLAKKTLWEPLYRNKRSLMLALLGDEEGARAELDIVATLPLCESCEYPKCKDLDTFRMQVDDVFGYGQRALEEARQGQKDWPDELDFATYERFLKRKGVC